MVVNQKSHWEDIDFSNFWQDVLPVTLNDCHYAETSSAEVSELFRGSTLK